MLKPIAFVLVACAALSLALAGAEPPISLNGTYTITSANVGDVDVSMTFTATVTNAGAEDVTGPIVLRHPNIIQKVWKRFGEQTIPAGGNVTVSDSVTVPRDQYDDWAASGPALFFYTQNDRGDIKTYRISLSNVPAPKSN